MRAIMGWAKRQKAGDPRAKAVLLVLADAASTKGQCSISQATIADETEQSVDTVQRRLADLELRGLIYRVGGKRKWSASGKWASNMIVVLADDICRSFAVQHGYDRARADGGAESAENQAGAKAAAPQSAVTPDCELNERNRFAGGASPPMAADCGVARGAIRASFCGAEA